MRYFLLLVLLGAAFLAQAATPERMTEFRLAYLYKENDQTSCMAAVMDMGAIFVAANCIKLIGNNTVDTSVSYKIRYSSTSDNVDPLSVLSPNQITVHPNYNPDTLENNIAIIQYVDGATDGFVGYIGAEDFIGNTDVYVRRDYNPSNSSWNKPVVANQPTNDSDCADGSPLYAANKDWMSCTSAVTTSSANSDCSIPYGIMYKQNTSAIIVMDSIYSHSVIYGSDMCTKSVKILSYYTVLWPYVGFGVKLMGRGVSIFNQTGGTQTNNKTINSMNSPKSISVPGTTIEGGDLYPKQLAIEASMSTVSASATDSNNDNNQSSSQSTTSSDNNNSDGLSKAQKIAIGVAVPLAVILIILCCIIVRHIWMVKRQDKAWDPNAESLNLHDIALEINAEDPFIVPPPYSQVSKVPSNESQQPKTTDTKK